MPSDTTTVDAVTDEHARRVIREDAAAKYVDLSVGFLRRARACGRGPAYVRVGRTIRYQVVDLDAWLRAHRVVTRESGDGGR